MENIIYNELRSRGYTVDVGVVEKRGINEEGKDKKKQLEIDFVANMGSKRYYIQSAFSMPTEEKRNQEKASLLNVNDSFKKIIVTHEKPPAITSVLSREAFGCRDVFTSYYPILSLRVFVNTISAIRSKTPLARRPMPSITSRIFMVENGFTMTTRPKIVITSETIITPF